MGLFTDVSAYSCHIWPFAAKVADNTQTYCWHVYALNVGNMKTWQYCNILSSKIKFTQYYIYSHICCREWLYGYSRCKITTWGYIQGSNIMNIIKSTKTRVNDKVWLNKNMKAFYHKTLKVGDPPLFSPVCIRVMFKYWD